jgi:hypothetical protein
MFAAALAGLSALGVPQVFSPGDPFIGNLSRVHLHITTVHDSVAMNMGLTADGMLPWTEWTGFQRDVIDWVATHAGFTYTLHSPSGDGPACPRKKDGSKLLLHQYAGNYNCGGDDVYTNNQTHVYWAQYYITPWRLGNSLFSVPVLSDVGLSLLMKPSVQSIWSKALFLYTPFKWDMWLLMGLTLLMMAVVMWLVDHSGTVDFKMRLAEQLPEVYGFHSSNVKNGYLKWSRFASEMPSYAVKMLHSQLGNASAFEPRDGSSSALNVALAVFCVVRRTQCSSRTCLIRACVFLRNSGHLAGWA